MAFTYRLRHDSELCKPISRNWLSPNLLNAKDADAATISTCSYDKVVNDSKKKESNTLSDRSMKQRACADLVVHSLPNKWKDAFEIIRSDFAYFIHHRNKQHLARCAQARIYCAPLMRRHNRHKIRGSPLYG